MKKHILLISIILMTSLGSFAQKFAYVNTTYILENVQAYGDAQKTLDGLSVTWQKEIENKYSEIDRMYKSYQAEQILLTEDMKKKREQEIVNKEKEVKDLQKQRFGKDGDLFRKRQELVKPIQDKVYNAVKKFSTDGNYAVIFDKASESITMLYTNAKYDKSDDILKAMGITPGPKTATGNGSKAGDSKTPQKPGETKTPENSGTKSQDPAELRRMEMEKNEKQSSPDMKKPN